MNHPRKFLHTFKGEITSDILVIVYSSKEVKGDVGVSMYSNILAGEYLIGFVIGTDYDKSALSSVSILSKSMLDEYRLNNILQEQHPNFIDCNLHATLLKDRVPD